MIKLSHREYIEAGLSVIAMTFHHGISSRFWFASDLCDVQRSPRGCRSCNGDGAPIPAQIADQLRGREFKNFRAFREAFWKAVASDPELAKQFNPGSLTVMQDGSAPYVRESEQVGGRVKVEVHHKIRIADGGGVYSIENLVVVTPRRHIENHGGGK